MNIFCSCNTVGLRANPKGPLGCVRLRVCVCVCACLRVCARACVRACVRVYSCQELQGKCCQWHRLMPRWRSCSNKARICNTTEASNVCWLIVLHARFSFRLRISSSPLEHKRGLPISGIFCKQCGSNCHFGLAPACPTVRARNLWYCRKASANAACGSDHPGAFKNVEHILQITTCLRHLGDLFAQAAVPKQSFDQPDAESIRLGTLPFASAVRNIHNFFQGQVKAGQVLRLMCGMPPLEPCVHFVKNAVRSQIDSLFLRGVLAPCAFENQQPQSIATKGIHHTQI